jgi:hypothetical protein
VEIAHSSRMNFVERPNPRGGVFCYKPLFQHEAGSAESFYFSISQTFKDFFSPRHRHNFDQIRFQLKGTCPFGHDGDMTPGTVGYFPEGTPYGPQTATEETIVLVLQFGGASGNGYMSERELQRSIAELKRFGEFKDGIFFRHSGTGRRQQDAYEVAWENWSGRRLEYPPQRYHRPIFMAPDAFAWVPDKTFSGVDNKHLGSFNERGTAIYFHRLAPAAYGEFHGPMVAYVTRGSGSADGLEVTEGSAFHFAAGEKTLVATEAGIEFFAIRLPQFANRSAIDRGTTIAA